MDNCCIHIALNSWVGYNVSIFIVTRFYKPSDKNMMSIIVTRDTFFSFFFTFFTFNHHHFWVYLCLCPLFFIKTFFLHLISIETNLIP
jgi:hypothetical protein